MGEDRTMSNVTHVEAIYLAAIERTNPDERAAYVESACAGDADLRRRVDELIAAHAKVGRFLEPPVDRTHAHVPGPDLAATLPGTIIDGRYKLLERIGEGGMGEVWMADQTEPVRRRVAIKLIKTGMDSRNVLARFEAERQALAVMDHPNIARVLDAGTTSDGRPYFVMELVKGTPITEFADARRLTPKQRLELFIPVCQAIQHAHQKGVIHRDIKPTNVLIALHDETPVPKVIDFGVAKAIGQPLTDSTLFTGFGTLVGTPAYMAPEQATFNQLDIDTRADVYALGVLLYELLAGSPPVESERLKKAALEEVLRLVREEEPPRPSQRLSTSQAKASIAAVRGGEPDRLSAQLRGELDWIVMKALEKDRGRRYDTATALAKDVQRYLAGDAVEACPPTWRYRLKKVYRRNRPAVLFGLMFTTMLLLGVAATTLLAIQAKRSEQLARVNELRAMEQQVEAERSKDAWLEVSERYLEVAREAEIRSASARIDADLLEYKSDPRIGLLRMARPLKNTIGPLPLNGPNLTGTIEETLENNPAFIGLRQFQTAAVIAAGQEFVPLLPPIDFIRNTDTLPPFLNVGSDEVDLHGRFYLSHTDQIGVEVWSIPDLKRIGLLREAKERIVRFGFSPDSKTIYTQDEDSIVRFWNIDATLRAKTPLRPERFIYPAGMSHKQIRFTAAYNRTLVADGVALLKSWQRIGVKPGDEQSDWEGKPGPEGPADLYSTHTGQFIRRLDRPGRRIADWKLSPDKRWLTAVESTDNGKGGLRDEAILILSAIDGRELARLDHPGLENSLSYEVSPTGKWVMTYRATHDRKNGEVTTEIIRLWDSSSWKPIDHPITKEMFGQLRVDIEEGLRFVTDDVIGHFWQDFPNAAEEGLLRIGQPMSWVPLHSLSLLNTHKEPIFGGPGGSYIRAGRTLVDARTFQRLNPPRGRKYHPDLARLAPDGRFFENLDTVTEKEIAMIADGHFTPGLNGHFIPGMGRIAFRMFSGEPGEFTFLHEPILHILPDAKRLDIPPAMLELWAQVVVGGELGPDGLFQKWDQPTWTAKQKQLATMKAPYADFPFPGWATVEPNLWYRVQAFLAKPGQERDKWLDEWRRRTGRVRPKLEPDSWRTPQPVTPDAELKPSPAPQPKSKP